MMPDLLARARIRSEIEEMELTLRRDTTALADGSHTAKGSALVGYRQSGVGAVARTASAKLSEFKNVRDYGAVLDGATDDYNAFMQAHDALSHGDTLYIDGPLRFTTPIVLTKAINLTCVGYTSYFLPDVGVTNDAITYNGAVAHRYVDWNVNIYGPASCCKNALVLDETPNSRYRLTIKAGAVEYGVRVRGCLSCEFDITISNNYNVPLAGAVMPADCVYLDASADASEKAPNASRFLVRLEGGVEANRDGIVTSDGSAEGNVMISGTIEGLTGRPLNVTNYTGFHIADLHMEGNTSDCLFTNCQAFHIGPSVTDDGGLDIDNCRNFVIDYSGSLDIDSASYAGEIGALWHEPTDTIVNASSSMRARGIRISTGSAVVLPGTPGDYPLENFFHNPYMDIWTAGLTAEPDGWGGANTAWVRSLATPDPFNPMAVKAQVTIGAAPIQSDGPVATPLAGFVSQAAERWVSFLIPIYVAAGQPNVIVYLYDGTYHNCGEVSTKGEWVYVRASKKIALSTSFSIQPKCYAAGYVTGVFFIGGLTIVQGPIQPQYLADHGRRSEYIVTSVANAPAFVGQRAFKTSTSTWYMAKGVAAPGDWIALGGAATEVVVYPPTATAEAAGIVT